MYKYIYVCKHIHMYVCVEEVMFYRTDGVKSKMTLVPDSFDQSSHNNT